MATRVQIDGHEATLDETLEWRCPTNMLLEELLNAYTARDFPHIASPSEPNRYATLSNAMAEKFSGEVLEVDIVPFDPTIIY